MTSNILIQFNHAATALHLSGRQMQLWMSLYEIITAHKQQDMALYTPLLLDKVQLCKRQFLRVRQALVDAGFLAIRHDENRQIRYTLLLNNREIAVATMVDDEANGAVVEDGEKSCDVMENAENVDETSVGEDIILPQGQRNGNHGNGSLIGSPTAHRDNRPSPTRNNRPAPTAAHPIAAKLTRRDYYEAIEDFCQSYNQPPMLLHSLCQWADMRLKNGWQLTAWGLEALLENLQEIAAGSVENMIATVKKSIQRRWKGFFSYTPDSRPNGAKLRRLEEKEERDNARRINNRSGVSHKFENEGRDLSYLVQ